MLMETESAPADSSARGHIPPIGAQGWLLLLTLAGVQFTGVMDFVLIMPLGPLYQSTWHITPQQFGFLVSAYAFTACISGFFTALVIDSFDRKQALLVLYAGFTIGTLLCGIAPEFWTLLLARCVAGAFGGVLGGMSLAVIGDVFHEKQRGLATGVVMSSFSVATVVGIPAGLEIAGYFHRPGTPFIVLGALSVVMIILAAIALPPLRSHMSSGVAHKRLPLAQLFFLPSHARAYVLMLCIVLGTFMVVPFISMYLVANTGYPQSELRWIYLTGGAATLVTMSVFGRLSDRYGKLLVCRILIILAMIPILLITNLQYLLSFVPIESGYSWEFGGMLIHPTLGIAVTIFVTTLFMTFTSGRMVPAMAMITSSAAPAYRGSFLSIISSVQQMGMGLASVLAGLLLTQATPSAPIHNYSLVGLLGCISSVVALVLVGQLLPASAVAGPHPSLMEGVAEAMAAETGLPGPVGEEGIVAVSEGVR